MTPLCGSGRRRRERIVAAAAKLGYVPNVNARSLVLRRTMTIGLIIPSASNVVYDQIIKGAESAARAAGYVLLLTESSDFGEVETAYRELVLGGRVDGLLIGSGNLNDSLPDVVFERTGQLRRAQPSHPRADPERDRGRRTRDEHRRGPARGAGPHPYRLPCRAGRRRHGDQAPGRLQGGHAEARLSVGQRYVERAAFSEAGGYEAMRRLLGLPDPPTAVAVSSVIAAVGALAACHDAEVAVPDDLSIIAFHDAEPSPGTCPRPWPLSGCRCSSWGSGHRLLVDIINGKSPASCNGCSSRSPG